MGAQSIVDDRLSIPTEYFSLLPIENLSLGLGAAVGNWPAAARKPGWNTSLSEAFEADCDMPFTRLTHEQQW